MERIEHKMAYNINIVNIGDSIIWKWLDSPFAFRYNNVIYLSHKHIEKPKVGEYLFGIKQMKARWEHLNEVQLNLKFIECFGNK